ncbi:hypothetical protein [Streptomyces virginiae]|uniref:hypothetical protein n=1 Tax=Streptomyces virginiae TaxID=1961 RepID=UPI00342E3AF9
MIGKQDTPLAKGGRAGPCRARRWWPDRSPARCSAPDPEGRVGCGGTVAEADLVAAADGSAVPCGAASCRPTRVRRTAPH